MRRGEYIEARQEAVQKALAAVGEVDLRVKRAALKTEAVPPIAQALLDELAAFEVRVRALAKGEG